MDHDMDTFELLPATKQDIPRLAQIHVAACMTDSALKLYFVSRDEFVHRVAGMLEEQIEQATWYHVKAVDRASGQIVSWASWKIPTDEEIRDRDRESKDKKESREESLASRAAEPSTEQDKWPSLPHRKGEFVFPGGLPSYVKQRATRWINDLTFNCRHIQARALFTDPPFERRGMATALVEWGNALADQAKLPACVLATSGAWQIYVSRAWRVLQHHDVDLGEWTSESYHDQTDRHYRFHYMLRLPQITSK